MLLVNSRAEIFVEAMHHLMHSRFRLLVILRHHYDLLSLTHPRARYDLKSDQFHNQNE